MATWGVSQFRGGFAGHVFAVAAEKARVEKENADKPAPERTQPKHEWKGQQARHALADALSEVLTDLRTGSLAGGNAPAPVEATDGTAADSATAGPATTASGAGASASSAAGGTSTTTTSAPTTSASTTSASSTAASSPATGSEPAAGSGTDAAAGTQGAERPDGQHPIREAIHDFMHALFEALRPSGAEGNGHGRGFAWGRTSVADLAQRIERLAQSFATPTAAPTTPADGPAPAPATGSDVGATTPAPVDATTPAATTDATDASTTTDAMDASTTTAATNASTTTTATDASGAPSGSDSLPASTPSTSPTPPAATTVDSPLLVAFTELLDALPGDRAGTAAASPADSLSALLHRLAQALGGDDGDATRPATGCLIDVTA